MNRILITIASAIVCSLFTNCKLSTNKEFEPPIFNTEGVASYFLLDDSLSYCGTLPYDMAVLDKYLVVLTWYNNRWVHFYDKKSGQYMGGCITQGRGPGEIITPEHMDVQEGKIGIFDSQTKRYSLFNYSDDDNAMKMTIEKVVRLDSCQYIPFRALRLKDERLLVDGQLPPDSEEGQQRFHVMNDNKELLTYNEFPINSKKSTWAYVQSRLVVSPNKERFACGTLYGATLEIFDAESLQLLSQNLFYEPKVTNEKGVLTADEGMIWGFSDLTASDNAIYGVLIAGKSPNDLGGIVEFDWKGNPMRRLSLGKITIQLAYSSSDNCLYGIWVNPETGLQFVRFSLE